MVDYIPTDPFTARLTDTPSGEYVLAVDIGGTATRAGVVDSGGWSLARARIATHADRGLIDTSTRIESLLRQVATEAGERAITAIGISTAGPVDPATGTYRHPPNLPGWHDLSMAPVLSSAFGLPVVVGHDATLAALAETRFGVHRGARDLVYVTLSTGIGAGIVAGGRCVTGSTGGAGEAGHMIVRPGGRSCGAGCRGCLEGEASGTAIAAAVREALGAGRASTLGLDADAAAVFAAAVAGDALAIEVVEDAIEAVATGLAGLLALLDPEVIVVGGGLTNGLDPWWEALLDRTREIALPRYAGGVPVERTTLGDDASLLGASLIAFEAVAG